MPSSDYSLCDHRLRTWCYPFHINWNCGTKACQHYLWWRVVEHSNKVVVPLNMVTKLLYPAVIRSLLNLMNHLRWCFLSNSAQQNNSNMSLCNVARLSLFSPLSSYNTPKTHCCTIKPYYSTSAQKKVSNYIFYLEYDKINIQTNLCCLFHHTGCFHIPLQREKPWRTQGLVLFSNLPLIIYLKKNIKCNILIYLFIFTLSRIHPSFTICNSSCFLQACVVMPKGACAHARAHTHTQSS